MTYLFIEISSWLKLQICTSWFTWHFFLRFPILSIYGMARYLKKHSWKQLLFCDSLFVDLKNGKKCDSRKVRKWHVTIYFYIKRIFICLNSLFPSFCFCNLVNINFTHKINSSITKENMVNGNIHWVFGFINCFTYFIFNLWFFTGVLRISIF